MTAPRLIFDRALLRRRLARASAAGFEDFLLERAGTELRQRLDLIRRDFSQALDVGAAAPEFALSLVGKGRSVVRLAPLPARAAPGVLTIVGDEEALPFAPESFDLVVSALSLQFVNDLPGALIQIRRALKPDGLFLGCLLGGQTLAELRSALAIAETELSGGVSPRVAPFADLRDMGGLLQRAGLALPVTDSEIVTVRYADMFRLMADLRAMGAANALFDRARKPARRTLFLRAAKIYAERFSDPDGRVRASFELVFVSGWAPHESQQKPLKPGSAKMRLADALKGVKPPS